MEGELRYDHCAIYSDQNIYRHKIRNWDSYKLMKFEFQCSNVFVYYVPTKIRT